MNKEYLKEELRTLSLSMFRKDFFGIYHGSLSAKSESNRFIINTKDAVFDNLTSEHMTELYYNKDYRWNEASIDAEIHYGIYKRVTDAKFISFTMPPFATAYSLEHSVIIPKDYFGHNALGEITIYDPKNFDDWYDRVSSEIPHYFANSRNNIMVIKGYGIYAYNRDVHEMAKQLAILEKSCRLLILDPETARLDLDF